MGSGTTFRIILPVHQEVSALQKKSNELYSGHGTILLADDEETIRITLQKILEFLGYNVILTKNGAEAVSVFRNQRDSIDIVILDMTMPVMDGKEAFKNIREIDKEKKVIILTGFINEQTLNLMKSIGDFSLVKKPFQKEELSLILSNMIGETQPKFDDKN